jgi:hypothetical protein
MGLVSESRDSCRARLGRVSAFTRILRYQLKQDVEVENTGFAIQPSCGLLKICDCFFELPPDLLLAEGGTDSDGEVARGIQHGTAALGAGL